MQKIAQDRASKPYHERSTSLPDVLAKLNYDQYRDIRFRRTSALWYDHAMFEVQFFHRGFQFDRRVNIYELVNNQVRAVPYNPAMFDAATRAWSSLTMSFCRRRCAVIKRTCSAIWSGNSS